jgi:hypothetical protein
MARKGIKGIGGTDQARPRRLTASCFCRLREDGHADSPRAIPRSTLVETGLLADIGDRRNRRLMPEESRQVGQDRGI